MRPEIDPSAVLARLPEVEALFPSGMSDSVLKDFMGRLAEEPDAFAFGQFSTAKRADGSEYIVYRPELGEGFDKFLAAIRAGKIKFDHNPPSGKDWPVIKLAPIIPLISLLFIVWIPAWQSDTMRLLASILLIAATLLTLFLLFLSVNSALPTNNVHEVRE